MLDCVTLPPTVPGNFHVYNQYTVRVPERDELRAFLKEKGVGSEVYYPLPMHLQNCYRDLGYQKGAFPLSEQAAEEVISIPIYAELTEAQQGCVVETIGEFYRRAKPTHVAPLFSAKISLPPIPSPFLHFVVQ